VAGENGIVSGMAGRYATALFELARESNALDQVQSDLNAFNALVASSPDLTRLVRSPLFSAQEQAKALDAVLDKAVDLARARGIEAKVHAPKGDPADALMTVAERVGADLIVVGNRGMTGARRLLGSVPNKVTHQATCSVLVVNTT